METINAPSFGNSKKSKKKTTASVLKVMDSKVRKVLLDNFHKNPNTQVQSFLKVPKQWVSLSDLDKLERYLIRNDNSVNHRTIQKDEVVIDVDSENKEYGKVHLAALEKIWNNFGYRRFQWDSGGDGYHAHFEFKTLNDYAKEDITEVKRQIIMYLCGNLMYMYKTKEGRYIFYRKKKKITTLEKEGLELCSHICLVDKKLIQIEWAPHRKGGRKLPYVSDLGFISSAELEGITPRIPKEVKDFIDENKKKRKAEYALRKWSSAQFTDSKYPACIRFYLGETINGKTFVNERDGTKRAMFHLISFFKHTKSDEELVDFIRDWLHKISLGQGAVDSHGKEISDWLIRISIKSNKGLVGCKARMELLEELGCDDICNGCPYKR